MILPQHKIIFVHIPKTAGQSVTKFLLENSGVKYTLKNKKYGLIFNNRRKMPGPDHFHHCTLNEYKSLNLVTDLNEYFKFTIFRNPYKRFVSSFYYNLLKHQCETYKEFIKMYEKTQYNFKEDLYRHFVPQTWYVDNKITNLDKWFFQEDLEQFKKFFVKKYNFHIPMQFINIQNIQKEPLDNYSISFIDKYYENDFNLLGYEYETPKNDSNF